MGTDNGAYVLDSWIQNLHAGALARTAEVQMCGPPLVAGLLTIAWALASPVSRVVVSGACHGNELTGAWVLRRLEQRAPELRDSYPSLCIEGLLSNPHALAENRRFVDSDNRHFSALPNGISNA